MTNYLAAIDLADEESRENILKTAVEMATGVEDARMFLMTVIPGVPAGSTFAMRFAARCRAPRTIHCKSGKTRRRNASAR